MLHYNITSSLYHKPDPPTQLNHLLNGVADQYTGLAQAQITLAYPVPNYTISSTACQGGCLNWYYMDSNASYEPARLNAD